MICLSSGLACWSGRGRPGAGSPAGANVPEGDDEGGSAVSLPLIFVVRRLLAAEVARLPGKTCAQSVPVCRSV